MLAATHPRERHDHELLRRYHHDHDLRARAELAERCMPLVRSIARRYAATSEPFDDLVQSGSVGLVKAIDRFDPDIGRRFVSYAVPNIQGEIRRHFRDRCWAVRAPRSVQELWQRVRAMQDQLASETGEPARDDDLAEALEVDVADVREARRAGESYTTRSLDSPAGEDRHLGDTIGETEHGYDDVDDRSVIAHGLEVLDDRQRHVLRERFEGGRLQREIAQDIGVSQMQVSRIVSGALEQMRDHLGTADHEPARAFAADRDELRSAA